MKKEFNNKNKWFLQSFTFVCFDPFTISETGESIIAFLTATEAS